MQGEVRKNDAKGFGYDFEWAIGLNRMSLNLLGIWPSFKQSGRVRAANSLGRRVRVPLMLGWMLILLVLPELSALNLVRRQLNLLVDNVLATSATLTSCIKLFFLWKSRHLMRTIVAMTLADWAAPRSEHEQRLMLKQARRARLFTISGYAIMFVSYSGFVATPFFGLSIRSVNNITDPGGSGRFLPLQTSYPFDVLPWPRFELLYASQIIAGGFMGVSMSVPDNWFGALVFHASGQCEILLAKLRALVPFDDAQRATQRWSREQELHLRRGLRHLCQQYVRLLRYVKLIEDSFNLLILAQTLCLSVIMCCLGFGVMSSIIQESGSSPIIQIVILGGTYLNLMIHMFVYCIASEILTEHCSGLTYAAYSSNWYVMPTGLSSDFLITMISGRCQVKLTAGKFIDLSLESYMKIMKAAAGYISMLWTVSKKN